MSRVVNRNNETGAPLLHDPDRERAMLEDGAAQVLARARAGGADAAEVSVSSSHGRNVTVRLGEIDVLEDARDRGVSVTVYINRASGSASTGDLSTESLARAVDQALAIARHTQPDPAGGLAPAELMATRVEDFDQWHPRELEMATLIERAKQIEARRHGGRRAGREFRGRFGVCRRGYRRVRQQPRFCRQRSQHSVRSVVRAGGTRRLGHAA